MRISDWSSDVCSSDLWMVRLDEHGRRAEWGVDRAGLVAGIDLAGDEMHPLARREGHLDGVRVVLQHRRDEDRVTEEELGVHLGRAGAGMDQPTVPDHRHAGLQSLLDDGPSVWRQLGEYARHPAAHLLPRPGAIDPRLPGRRS